MTKEEELMNFLHERVFDPILYSKNVPSNIKRGTRCTIMRMTDRCKTADKMVLFFWSAIIQENAIKFSKLKKVAGLPRFEDVFEEFRDKFNNKWLAE